MWQGVAAPVGRVRAIEMRNGGNRTSIRAGLGCSTTARAGNEHGEKEERTTNEW